MLTTRAIDLETVTVARLLRMLDDGQVTSADLVQACADRIAALDTAVHAIRALNPAAAEEARIADEARARGERGKPLLGVPVLLKDNIDVAGMPTTAGSVALAASYPAGDAALVTGLRAAGAVILGKTNLTEFANFLADGMPGGYSSLGGQVLNPYDTSESPSGSSSGSAVAAAMGYAPLTVGTETSGSILSPAASNSVVGIKPTVGLVSRTGVVPIAASQDTAGPMTRTVADAAYLLTALTGIDQDDAATAANPLADHDFTRDLRADALRGARIGVVRDQIPPDTTDNRSLWDAAVAVLREQGATLVEVELDTDEGFDSTVLNYEFKRDLNAYFARLPESAPIRTLAEVIAYNEAHAGVALKFGQARALAAQAMDLSPGSADTRRHDADRARDLADSRDRLDGVMAEHRVSALLFAGGGSASIGAKAGYPSISVPAGYRAADRRPFAIALLGPAWSEPTLVGYAYAFEQAARV
ncbi:MAG: amidase family protein, partial [Actinomycetota bacterium]|nr:amidase family protein [Actinomycetota bacterium]